MIDNNQDLCRQVALWAHELVHVNQYRKMGWEYFLNAYLFQFAENFRGNRQEAYCAIPEERNAYINEWALTHYCGSPIPDESIGCHYGQKIVPGGAITTSLAHARLGEIRTKPDFPITPPVPVAEIAGVWENPNPQAGHVRKVQIRNTNGKVYAAVFGSCYNTACPWGEWEIAPSIDGKWTVTYEDGGVTTTIHMEVIGAKLKFILTTDFSPTDTRKDESTQFELVRQISLSNVVPTIQIPANPKNLRVGEYMREQRGHLINGRVLPWKREQKNR